MLHVRDPLEGRVLGARDDEEVALDPLVVEAIGHERAAARASLQVVGDVACDKLEKLLEAAMEAVEKVSPEAVRAAAKTLAAKHYAAVIAASARALGWGHIPNRDHETRATSM